MKKLLAVASATLMLSSVAGVAVAHHDDDHTQNYHGMCTAYFSGSETGQENKRSDDKNDNSAFQMFEDTAVGDRDEDGDVDAYDVADFCNEWTQGFGNPGQGNDPWFDNEGDEPSDTCGFEQEQCDALDDQDGGRGDNNGNQNPPGQG